MRVKWTRLPKVSVMTLIKVRRSFHPIDFKQMALDLTHAHPARIHRNDPIIETGKPPPVARDQLWIERSRPITGDVSSRTRPASVSTVFCP